MLKIIKTTLIVIAILSALILAILFLQDRTKKLEDRKYKEINKITIESNSANINFYKSVDEQVRVVVYGSSKDKVQIIEGTKYLNISKDTKKKTCILNCKNEIDIYVPDNIENVEIKNEVGNILFDKVTVKNISINSETGDIDIYNTNILNINSKVGDILVNTINATNNSSIKTETGNVTIEKGSVVIPVIKEEQDFTLNIDIKVGNVDIKKYENKSE